MQKMTGIRKHHQLILAYITLAQNPVEYEYLAFVQSSMVYRVYPFRREEVISPPYSLRTSQTTP